MVNDSVTVQGGSNGSSSEEDSSSNDYDSQDYFIDNSKGQHTGEFNVEAQCDAFQVCLQRKQEMAKGGK